MNWLVPTNKNATNNKSVKNISKYDIFRMTFDDLVFEEYLILFKFTIYVEINHLNPN